MNIENRKHRELLQQIARRVMLERGLWPDFSDAARAELLGLPAAAPDGEKSARDLREMPWCSIDNDDSLDLDQLTAGEALPGESARLYVAIADVDALVKDGTAIDAHARHNTTSVYTAAQIFSMLPEELSTGRTSLNFKEDRLAIVVEMVVGPDGAIREADVYRAQVTNHARLAYPGLAAWLEGERPAPEALARVRGLAEALRVQDQAARRMQKYRQSQGALSLETVDARPVFEGDQIRDIEVQKKNRARRMIEDLMIAANGVTARYLSARKFPSIRRVVSSPKRWDRIADLAEQHGGKLPPEPDPVALDHFLDAQQAADPLRFPDLSLAVIKLLGAGEYTAEQPDGDLPGHFGLAVKDYAHSTAPNRRYTDLLTQRLLKAAILGLEPPYRLDELAGLARHCTAMEDVANKVERQVNKSAAALLLETRIGERFAALVTGAAEKGTWVRLISLPVEGRLVEGFRGVDVGDRVRVQLESVSVEKGFIDFKKVG